MRNFILAAIAIVVLSRIASTSGPVTNTEHSYVHVTLHEPKEIASEPLTEEHLGLPIQQISRVTTPGMEPAKEPVLSRPVVYAPAGHYETQYYGFRGRQSRRVWVPSQSATYQYNYSSGGCSNGPCSRGGIF